MPRYKITIEYDGKNFHGWQNQQGLRTVQNAIEDSIKKFCGKKISIYAAGRTDTGVHAKGQVAHLDLREESLEDKKGKLGNIVSANVLCWLYKHKTYYKEKWRIKKGGGPLGINLVHDIDLICYLLGPVKSVQAYSDFTYAFWKALALRPVVVVGHSMGGAIAMDLALRYSDMVEGLALTCTAPKFDIPAEIIRIVIPLGSASTPLRRRVSAHFENKVKINLDD